MQIKTVALYGPTGAVRELNFKLGQVNVITGQSRTGKSAIIDIIDYCMGRSTFRVFEGVNRDVVTWYAVLLQAGTTQIFVAKPAPKSGASSQSSVFLRVGEDVAIPDVADLVLNSNDDALTSYLSEIIGISPNLSVPGQKHTRLPLQATVDHAKFFLFQEQGEIANRALLFHRQGEQFFPQAIKDTLPYLLGAVPEDRLTLVQEERELRRTLRTLERREAESKVIGGNQSPQALRLVAEAKEVGLLEQTADMSSTESIRAALQEASRWQSSAALAQPEVNSQLSVSMALDKARRDHQEEYDRLLQVKYFETQTEGFGSAALEQVRRLQAINILPTQDPQANVTCPLCGSEDHGVPIAEEIRGNLAVLEKDLEIVEARRPRLREHAERLGGKVVLAKARSQALQTKLRLMAQTADAAQAQQDINARVAIVVGRISLYLESVAEVAPDASLSQEINSVRARLQVLDELLDDEQAAMELNSALNRIGVTMTELAKFLELEFAGSPYRLDLNALTVIADTSARAIPMDRMGSGENWLGCHLIALLALHKHFVQNRRPVPGFLIIDQPSQVYFPSSASYRALDGTTIGLVNSDADIDAVSRMFKLLQRICSELAPNFQIIVTEHANLPETWFQEMLVEPPWRDGRALIPSEWIAE